MDALADRLITSARPGQAAPEICRALMTELAELLGRLFGDETAMLAPTSGDATTALPFAEQIAAFKAEVAELSESWQGYIAKWDEAHIIAERSRYSGETTDLMTVFKLSLVTDFGLPSLMTTKPARS